MNEEVQYEEPNIGIVQDAKEKVSKWPQEAADLIKKGEYNQASQMIEEKAEEAHMCVQLRVDKELNEAHKCIDEAKEEIQNQFEETYHRLEEEKEARLCNEGDIHALYRSLKHKVFKGRPQGQWNKYGKEWEMIDVDKGSTDIIQILRAIHPIVNGRVWKGFTGPEDSTYYTNYRFFAEKNERLQLQYMITNVKEFNFPANSKYPEGTGFKITISGFT